MEDPLKSGFAAAFRWVDPIAEDLFVPHDPDFLDVEKCMESEGFNEGNTIFLQDLKQRVDDAEAVALQVFLNRRGEKNAVGESLSFYPTAYTRSDMLFWDQAINPDMLHEVFVFSIEEDFPGTPSPGLFSTKSESYRSSDYDKDAPRLFCIRPITPEFSKLVCGFDIDLPSGALQETLDSEEFNVSDSLDFMTDGNDYLEDSHWGWVADSALRIRVSEREPELINGLFYFSGRASWTRVKGQWERVPYFFQHDASTHRFVRPEHARDLVEVFDGPHRKLSTYEGFLFDRGLDSPPEDGPK
jgi:hypothetical protein